MVSITDTPLEAEQYEQRYSIPLGKSALRFVRRRVSIAPADGTICLVDNGPRVGIIPRGGAAHFLDGKWHGINFEPSHWTVWEELDGKA